MSRKRAVGQSIPNVRTTLKTKQDDTVRRNPAELVEWDELAEWQRDNEYIISGYRQASYSFYESTRSVLRLHNETVNIWSHLLGALAFLLLGAYSTSTLRFPEIANAKPMDVAALAAFFLAFVVCFVLSTCFHTFSNHSKEGHSFSSRLDHLGIVLVFWGSTAPNDYFGFYCESTLQTLYVSLATISGVGSAIFTLQPRFRNPKYRVMRFFMYSALGLSAFIPVVHGTIVNGWEIQNRRMSVSFLTGLGMLHFIGAAIYAARIPERWYPRTFDIYGASHQLMHVLVVVGAVSHSIGLIRAFEYWTEQYRAGYPVCLGKGIS